MHSNEIIQLGEPPGYDKDLGLEGARLAKGIKKQILLGNFDAGDAAEERMVREFKASKLGIKKFLATWKR
jgi:hypothetical protein